MKVRRDPDGHIMNSVHAEPCCGCGRESDYQWLFPKGEFLGFCSSCADQVATQAIASLAFDRGTTSGGKQMACMNDRVDHEINAMMLGVWKILFDKAGMAMLEAGTKFGRDEAAKENK